MNSGWEKYFLPSYGAIQEVRSPIKESIFFGGLCFLISLGLILNLKQTRANTDKLIFLLSTQPGLVQKIEILEAQNSILQSEIVSEKHKFTKQLETKTEKFLNNYNSLLAINKYKGEGVIITLNDSTKPLTYGENPNLMIVHNLDLLSIVNELWGSGAKAISVNDQRITATSEFNCIGPIILINKSRVLPPFTIKAIGDPEELERAVSNGYIKKYDLENFGIKFTIQKNESIEVPASSKTPFASFKGNL
ncbi:MAG: DUF881 domain-containing protein [Cyanobacteriota bacterium]